MLRFRCPRCKVIDTAPDANAGQQVSCRKCAQSLILPRLSPSPGGPVPENAKAALIIPKMPAPLQPIPVQPQFNKANLGEPPLPEQVNSTRSAPRSQPKEPLWYYSLAGRTYGPISGTSLKALAEAGQLSPADLVRREGTSDWTEASTIEGLFPPAPRPTPARPLRGGDTSPEPLPVVLPMPTKGPRPKRNRDDEAERAKNRRTTWTIVTILGAALMLTAGLAAVGFCIAFSTLFDAAITPRNNARCLNCSHEFRIPERHRGTPSEASTLYRCPRCGTALPPIVLYKDP